MSTRASAYVRNNELVVLGVDESRIGQIPFSVKLPIESDEPVSDGPVDTENASDGVLIALDKARDEIKSILKRDKLKAAIESLVLRARAGDQNAMAMIAAVRQNAARGYERAIYSVNLLKKYIKRNKPRTNFGVEHIQSPDSQHRAAAIITMGTIFSDSKLYHALADGPPLNEQKNLMSQMLLAEDLQKAFQYGFKNCRNPQAIVVISQQLDDEQKHVTRIGYLAGKACILQAIRNGGPLSLLSPVVGWELGE